MRFLLLALMIVLLPLRGWGGDAMATGMAAGQVQHLQVATKSIAAHTHDMGAEMHVEHEASVVAQAAPDCAGHASGDTSHTADTHCDSCSACQACHTVALSTTAPDLNPVFHAFTLPRAAAHRFASAEAALGQKPPIS